MKEDFLHYVWQYKKFAFSGLITVQGELLQILDTGNSLRQSGPDFFNARIILDDQKWAGNVEIHLKSSDWYLHQHERDPHYDNVILHVVWKHDAAVFRKDNSEIPVLEICHYVSSGLIRDYQKLQNRFRLRSSILSFVSREQPSLHVAGYCKPKDLQNHQP